jgi:hypothetical protein
MDLAIGAFPNAPIRRPDSACASRVYVDHAIFEIDSTGDGLTNRWR